MDGALRDTTTPRALAERAISRIGGRDDRARRADLREGLYQPGTWAVFLLLGHAGQAGVLAALAFCQDAEEVADAVQAAALLGLDPLRQAASARAARGHQLPAFDLEDPEALARNGASRARRGHQARALGGDAPDPADSDDGDPLALLLRAEAERAEDGDDCSAAVQVAAALLAAKPPRPRGRPTRSEVLERGGQIKLPGLPPGGSTTRAAGPPLPPPAHALGRPPPEQPNLF